MSGLPHDPDCILDPNHEGPCEDEVGFRADRLSAPTEQQRVAAALSEVEVELAKALAKFGSFNSPHEGKAVIEAELEELWEHVKKNTGRGLYAREEAIQVAAMALRYAVDLCYGQEVVVDVDLCSGHEAADEEERLRLVATDRAVRRSSLICRGFGHLWIDGVCVRCGRPQLTARDLREKVELRDDFTRARRATHAKLEIERLRDALEEIASLADDRPLGDFLRIRDLAMEALYGDSN